jgi:HK97 family phage major capsid protein
MNHGTIKMRERRSMTRYAREFGGTMGIGFTGFSMLRSIMPVLLLLGVVGVAFAHNHGAHAAGHGFSAMGAVGAITLEQKDFDQLKSDFTEGIKSLRENLGKFKEDADKEIKAVGKMSEDTKQNIDKTLSEISEFKGRLTAIEQKLTAPRGGEGDEAAKSLGQVVTESDEFKSITSRGASFKGSASFSIPKEIWRKTAIVNATGQNQPLVPSDRRAGIIGPQLQRLRIRDLLNTVRTASNMIEFTKEASFTNNAAPQGKSSSPQVYENVAKAESAMTFTLENEPVQTIAHWIPASKQVLADAPQLQGYIDGRLRYGLKLKEEAQLLSGTGAGGDLNGLITQATAYSTGYDVVGDTKIDTLRRIMLQAELAFFELSGFVLNPQDWADIELKKDVNKNYIYGSPSGLLGPSIWGRPVVSTPSVSQGTFLAGDFSSNVCDIYDREEVNVTISTEHDTFFIKNMVAILCEERLALVVYKPEGLLHGSYPASA